MPHLGLAAEVGVEEAQLLVYGCEVEYRVVRRHVQHVHQQAATLAVSQELVAEAQPTIRALDQACAMPHNGRWPA